MREPAADEVVLRLPARPEYGRIARIGAASLGLRQGMSFGEIDDLRRVVDETFALLLDGCAADNGHHTPSGTAPSDQASGDNDSSGLETVSEDGARDCELEIVFRADDDALELHAARSPAQPLSEDAVHRFDAFVAGLVDDCDVDALRAKLRIRRSVTEVENPD